MKSGARPILFGESFSPWTKKARWALEQCGLEYRYKEYTPTLSEPGLRWRLQQWSGSISVPLLIVDGKVYRDSWEISRFANNTTGTDRLGNFAEIAPWNDLSEAALAEGRTRVVRCILRNDQALEESLPAFVPAGLRSSLCFVARDAVRRLDRKYAHLVRSGALREALEHTREGLAQTGSDYLLGRFSYADIAMAVLLEVIQPIAQVEPPLSPAIQDCWKDSELAKEFKDLLAWRDRLATTHATSYSQFMSV